jgi:hypothetical protein
MSRRVFPAPALAALLTAACAPVRGPGGPAPGVLELSPERLEVRRADLDLVDRNDEELFALGRAAAQAGDLARAAAAFERLADLFPASRRHAAALYQAGLAREGLEEWRPALLRFASFRREDAGPGADQAAFHQALCHHRLGERAEARALLDALSEREGLPPLDRMRALTERGVLELEQGQLEQAEKSLQLALSVWDRADQAERFDDEAPAKAHFWLGEVYRAWFAALPLDLAAGEEALAEALERKSQLLLQAQGHYLRGARRGSPGFGVAGVARVGEMYEALYARLADAPVPPELDPAEAAAWRQELWSQLRVLVRKAVEAYEGALTAARARGVDNRFAEDAERGLERLKRLLAPADADEPPEGRGGREPAARP